MAQRLRVFVGAIAMWLAACSGSPTGPSGPGVLRIAGPSTIAPASTVKFNAIYFKDGRDTDVTASTTWSVNTTDAVSMNNDGSATGLSNGEAIITAKYQGLSDVRPILILESNTYKFAGRVMEGALGIGGVSIEVVRGTGTGLRTLSQPLTGNFVLYGIAGAVQFQVTVDGYSSRLIDFVVNSHVTTPALIELTPTAGPPGIFAGRWTFWMSAPPCGFLPPAVLHRSFVADITHTGVRVVVKVSGPGVYAEPAMGQASPGEIGFQFPFWPLGIDGSTPIYGLMETFNPQAFLGITAAVNLNDVNTILPGSYEGTFDGSFDYYPTGHYNVVTQCAGRGRAGLNR